MTRSVMMLVLLGLTGSLGCSDAYSGRHALSGVTRLHGQLLDEGTIEFVPLDGQATRAGTVIRAGQFAISREAGLEVGKYLVRVSSGDGKIPADPTEAPGPTNIVSRDRIPAEWNVRSRQEVTIAQGSKNAFHFEIP